MSEKEHSKQDPKEHTSPKEPKPYNPNPEAVPDYRPDPQTNPATYMTQEEKEASKRDVPPVVPRSDQGQRPGSQPSEPGAPVVEPVSEEDKKKVRGKAEESAKKLREEEEKRNIDRLAERAGT